MDKFIEAFYKEVNVGGENPVERWGKLGFLRGLNDDHQIDELVWSFEAMAKYFMDHPDIEEKWGMGVFPMLRRIICGIITEKDDWIDVLNRRITPEEFFSLFDNHTVNDLIAHARANGDTYRVRRNYLLQINGFYTTTLCAPEKRGLSLSDYWSWYLTNADELKEKVKEYTLVVGDFECNATAAYTWYAYELLKKEVPND